MPETPGPTRLSRRALLTLGGAVLLVGCSGTTSTASTASARSPRLAGTRLPPTSATSATATATAAATPSSFPSAPRWAPAVARPVPGACPGSPNAVTSAIPQQYLPCQGTNIALTVDDGPHPEWTPQVLALLARYDIRATFCMIGENAAAHPDLVRRVIDGGHHIANHTFTHPLGLKFLTPAQIRAEIERATDAIVAGSSGIRPRLFRAPGGIWSPSVISACTSAGLRPLDWSVDPRDWSRPGVKHIVDTILTTTHPGSIILDHDGGGNRQQTVQALGIALPRLLDAGYHFAQP